MEKELQGVEFAVEQFKQSNRLTDVSEQAKLYMDMVKSIDIRKAEQETQVNIINALEKDLVAGAFNPRIVPSTLGVTDLSAARLIDQYNQLILERERVASTSGIRNPALTEYDNQIRELRLNLLENIRNLKSAYQIALNDVKSQDRKLNERLVNVPALERRLLEISRDRNVKQQIYLFLLQKREESAIALASSVTDSRTIEQPRPSKKVKPNTPMIYGFGLLGGLFLALIPIILIDVFDNKVGSPNEIARKCQAPLIGELNHVKQLTNPIQVGDRKRSVIAEQIRAIRTNISFTGKGSQIKTILITSHIPGEGKSFCSLNIAASYALLDKKVAVLEFDLRRPRLLKNLALTSVKGISNYLSGQSAFEEIPIVIDGYQGNLHILPSGPIPPNPAELILSQRMKDLQEALLSRYDYILIDSPPFSLVTDAMLLRQYVDLTIVVLRQGYSHKDAYGVINERFLPESVNSPAYIILNGVNRHSRYSYYNSKYAYGAYGYGYGYNYGYVNKSNGYYSDDKA